MKPLLWVCPGTRANRKQLDCVFILNSNVRQNQSGSSSAQSHRPQAARHSAAAPLVLQSYSPDRPHHHHHHTHTHKHTHPSPTVLLFSLQQKKASSKAEISTSRFPLCFTLAPLKRRVSKYFIFHPTALLIPLLPFLCFSVDYSGSVGVWEGEGFLSLWQKQTVCASTEKKNKGFLCRRHGLHWERAECLRSRQ